MASLEVFQDMINRQENPMLKACTGLEGGIVASGSTCGVVTGGALGLALMYNNEIQERGLAAKIEVLSIIGDYVRWFKKNFGSSLCRDRSGVDFYTTMGHIRYLFPGDRVGKCLWHIRGAMRHLYTYQLKDLPELDVQNMEIQGDVIHCAQAVLKGIKDRTGIGDPLLERLSFIFDGGPGIQGGICGGLAGAVMGINFFMGMNIREMKYLQILKAITVGHINLISNKPIDECESFAAGKKIVQQFREKVGAIECRTITGKEFSNWQGFHKHIVNSDNCKALIELAIDEASKAIEIWK